MSEIVTPKCPQCGAEMPGGATGRVCPRCAAAFLKAAPTEMPGDATASPRPFTPPPVADLAPLFPRLEILELIGQGGMGAVYKARQKELDRIVALKILPPGIGDAAFAERFAREAKALARLNHPGIVTIYEFGRSNGLFFFLMEFVDGATLRQVLRGGRISPREALAIVPAICDALQYAHDQGIVHRDIKPENILLDRRGRTKVADFGLAKLMQSGSAVSDLEGSAPASASTVTQASKVLGTPQYMAPEQIEHPAAVDHRADIYALGVVFYQMLTGELPGQRIEPPSRKVQIDLRLDEVVLRALEKDPALRYAQAGALKTDVETIAMTEGTAGAAPTTPALFTPANCLLCVGLLNFVTIMVIRKEGMAWNVGRGGSLFEEIMSLSMMGFGMLRPFAVLLTLVSILGAWRMRTYRDLALGKWAIAVSMLLPPGCLIGFPVGLWIWRRINSPTVRTAFEDRARQEQSGAWAGDPLTPNAARIGMVITVCVAAMGFLTACILPMARDSNPIPTIGTRLYFALTFVLPFCLATMICPIAGWLAWDGLGSRAKQDGTIRNAVIAATFLPLAGLPGPSVPVVSSSPAWFWFSRALGISPVLFCLISFGIVWFLAVNVEKHWGQWFSHRSRLHRCLGWTTPSLIAFACALGAWTHTPRGLPVSNGEVDSIELGKGQTSLRPAPAKSLDWLKLQLLDGWISDLQNPEQKVQKTAERALAEMGTNALPEFLGILRETNDSSGTLSTRQFNTAQALRFMGPGVKFGLPAFAALLKSGEQANAYPGAAALAFSAPLAPEAFSILTNGLTDSAPGIRDAANYGVGLCLNTESNSFAEPALPLLVQNLKDKIDCVRSDAAVALMLYAQRQSFHFPPRDAKPDLLIPPLVELLQDKYIYARENATYALADACFRERVKSWIPAIQKLLNDPDEGVRQSAADLLQRFNMHASTNVTEKPGMMPAFSVQVTGTNPLSYQWYYNLSTNGAGASNAAPK